MSWRVPAVAALLVLGLVGCGGKLTRGLGVQEVVVYFAANASAADHAAVLHECSGIPGTIPEPLPGPSAPLSSRDYGVRFRVDHASNVQLARLLSCLASHRSQGVVGYNIPDTSD